MQTNKNNTKVPLRSHEKIISQVMPSLIDEKHDEVSLINNVSPTKDRIYFRSNQNCTKAFNETYSNSLKAKYYITLLSTLIKEEDIKNLSSDLKDKVKASLNALNFDYLLMLGLNLDKGQSISSFDYIQYDKVNALSHALSILTKDDNPDSKNFDLVTSLFVLLSDAMIMEKQEKSRVGTYDIDAIQCLEYACIGNEENPPTKYAYAYFAILEYVRNNNSYNNSDNNAKKLIENAVGQDIEDKTIESIKNAMDNGKILGNAGARPNSHNNPYIRKLISPLKQTLIEKTETRLNNIERLTVALDNNVKPAGLKEDINAYMFLSKLDLIHQDKLLQAIKAQLSQIISEQPNNVYALLSLGYLTEGKESFKYLTKVIALQKLPIAYLLLGYNLLQSETELSRSTKLKIKEAGSDEEINLRTYAKSNFKEGFFNSLII